MIELRCVNNAATIKVERGTTLAEAYQALGLALSPAPVAAKVNNEVMTLGYRLFGNKTIEYIDVTTSIGMKIYTRTLFFVLCKAVHDLWGGGVAQASACGVSQASACGGVAQAEACATSPARVRIEFPVSGGYYCPLELGRDVTPDDVAALRRQMDAIIAARIPIRRHQRPTEEVIELFRAAGDNSKVQLLSGLGRMYTIYCSIDDYNDSFYGPTLINTGDLTLYGLEMFYDGLLLRLPQRADPTRLVPYVRQDKMFDIFSDQHRWQDMLGISTVGTLNAAIDQGQTNNLINLFEALQEKQLSRIADQIAARRDVRVVLLAGPSSSGKTTSCKRLSVQLLTNGLRPVELSMDDYFLDRERTPKDEHGEYDFESLYALDLDMFNRQLTALIAGEEVELPRYNFHTGKSEQSGRRLRLRPKDVLVMEGIHALNPALTQQIPPQQVFRVYASALTTITLDDHNYIPTTDNRLLRRLIRDYKYRGVAARDTLHRWPSVRAGEEKWIFPFQENADAMFNTAMLFELAVLKTQAEPLLEQVPQNCPEYAEAVRLRDFLRYIRPMQQSQIPPTSLLREFLGGSSFEY